MFEDRFTCLLSSSQQPDEQTTSRDKSVLFSLRVITACPLTLSHSTRMRGAQCQGILYLRDLCGDSYMHIQTHLVLLDVLAHNVL